MCGGVRCLRRRDFPGLDSEGNSRQQAWMLEQKQRPRTWCRDYAQGFGRFQVTPVTPRGARNADLEAAVGAAKEEKTKPRGGYRR